MLVLLVHAYAGIKPLSRWHVKVVHGKFVDIGKIYDCIGENMSELLPHIHAITCCDTTSFFSGVGKGRIFKKIMTNPAALDLLKSLGVNKELHKDHLQDAIKVIQTIMYSGKEDESLVSTRVHLYKVMKTKSSQALPPDPESIQQAIQHVHYRIYYWLRCVEERIVAISCKDNVWTVDIEQSLIQPVRFTGKYLCGVQKKISLPP